MMTKDADGGVGAWDDGRTMMTKDAPEQFVQAFNALAATKGSAVDDVKQESYFQTLGPLPIDSVVEAAQDLQREPGAYLPDAGTWYRRAAEAACLHLVADEGAQALRRAFYRAVGSTPLRHLVRLEASDGPDGQRVVTAIAIQTQPLEDVRPQLEAVLRDVQPGGRLDIVEWDEDDNDPR